jgi:hypothetical protein
MDGMHDHGSHNHKDHQAEKYYVDGSKTKITDKMFSTFSARGIEKTFNDDKDVKKVQVNLEKGKVLIAYAMNKKVDLDEIKNIFLSNGQTATGIIVRKV